MKTRRARPARDETAIDRAVVAQAEDETAWEEPVYVSRPGALSVQLPPELAARAAFFARLHRADSVERWVTQIIEERTEVEEAAFASLKRDLASAAAIPT